jgi:hypothetical protein
MMRYDSAVHADARLASAWIQVEHFRMDSKLHSAALAISNRKHGTESAACSSGICIHPSHTPEAILSALLNIQRAQDVMSELERQIEETL